MYDGASVDEIIRDAEQPNRRQLPSTTATARQKRVENEVQQRSSQQIEQQARQTKMENYHADVAENAE